jgi:hypothetical protein
MKTCCAGSTRSTRVITYPDFEGEYIDQEVFFMHKPPVDTTTNVTTTSSTTTSTTTTTPPLEQTPPAVSPSSVGGRGPAASWRRI